MADLVLDIIIDDVVDLTVLPPPSIDVTVSETELAVVEVPGPRGPRGFGANYFTGTLAGNNTATVFIVGSPATNPTQINVYRNGLREVYGIGFTATVTPASTTLTFSSPPLTTDTTVVVFQTPGE